MIRIKPFKLNTADGEYSSSLCLIAAAVPLLAVACVFYGGRVLLAALAAVSAAAVIEFAAACFSGSLYLRGALSSAAAALAVALFCPASVPLWLPAAGAALASVCNVSASLLKRRLIFSKAAIGLLAMLVAFPNLMKAYCEVSHLAIAAPEYKKATSVLSLIVLKRNVDFSVSELFSGRYPGPLGTTSLAVLLVAAVYLFLRRKGTFEIAAPFIGALCVFALLFNRTGNALHSLLCELSGGSAVFAALFLACDPDAVPSRAPARAVYGFAAGTLTMILRVCGLCESAPIFAVLLAGLASDPLDAAADLISKARRSRREGEKRRKTAQNRSDFAE